MKRFSITGVLTLLAGNVGGIACSSSTEPSPASAKAPALAPPELSVKDECNPAGYYPCGAGAGSCCGTCVPESVSHVPGGFCTAAEAYACDEPGSDACRWCVTECAL